MGIDPTRVAFMRGNQAAIHTRFRELGAGFGDDAADHGFDDEPAR